MGGHGFGSDEEISALQLERDVHSIRLLAWGILVSKRRRNG